MDSSDFPLLPFHIRDIAQLGLTRRQVERATDSGALRRLVRGAYVRADQPDTIDLRAAAVALAVSPHHVAINRTASWVLGLDMLTMTEHDLLPPIEVAALRGHRATRVPQADGRSRDLAADDIMTVGSLRLTTALRTALDLGCELHRRDAFASMVMLARHHGFTRAELATALPRYRRRRGVIQLRSLVPLVDPRLESVREAWALVSLHDAGLPSPEPQWWIVIDGRPTYRLDFAWVHAKVCLEYDGEADHDRTEDQRAADRERRDWLRRNGWTVIVIRRGCFTGDALATWLREVREALAPTYTNRRW